MPFSDKKALALETLVKLVIGVVILGLLIGLLINYLGKGDETLTGLTGCGYSDAPGMCRPSCLTGENNLPHPECKKKGMTCCIPVTDPAKERVNRELMFERMIEVLRDCHSKKSKKRCSFATTAVKEDADGRGLLSDGYVLVFKGGEASYKKEGAGKALIKKELGFKFCNKDKEYVLKYNPTTSGYDVNGDNFKAFKYEKKDKTVCYEK